MTSSGIIATPTLYSENGHLEERSKHLSCLSCIKCIDITLIDDKKFSSSKKMPANKCQKMMASEHHVIIPNEIIDSGNNH